MQSAIATLPWVEKATIKTDAGKKQVRFAVKDAKEFSDDAVIAALKEKGSKYSSGAKRLTGPTADPKGSDTKTN